VISRPGDACGVYHNVTAQERKQRSGTGWYQERYAAQERELARRGDVTSRALDELPELDAGVVIDEPPAPTQSTRPPTGVRRSERANERAAETALASMFGRTTPPPPPQAITATPRPSAPPASIERQRPAQASAHAPGAKEARSYSRKTYRAFAHLPVHDPTHPVWMWVQLAKGRWQVCSGQDAMVPHTIVEVIKRGGEREKVFLWKPGRPFLLDGQWYACAPADSYTRITAATPESVLAKATKAMPGGPCRSCRSGAGRVLSVDADGEPGYVCVRCSKLPERVLNYI
jgi:hypothetical protein